MPLAHAGVAIARDRENAGFPKSRPRCGSGRRRRTLAGACGLRCGLLADYGATEPGQLTQQYRFRCVALRWRPQARHDPARPLRIPRPIFHRNRCRRVRAAPPGPVAQSASETATEIGTRLASEAVRDSPENPPRAQRCGRSKRRGTVSGGALRAGTRLALNRARQRASAFHRPCPYALSDHSHQLARPGAHRKSYRRKP